MVDVFISYSKVDRKLVERIDAALNSAGFTTWWDRGLTVGEDFAPAIERHLVEARAVVCLWTESSVKSQWVRAEASKANVLGKLVPVKSAGVGYEDIPPPFNVLDTGSAEESGRLVEAVRALIERPHVEPSRLFLLKARTRREFLSWFGIFGAVLTVTANIRGLVDVARWAQWLLGHWLDGVAWFWKTVLFFLPQLTVDDASLLAILLFLALNIAACLRLRRVANPLWATVLCLVAGAWIVGSIYASAFDRVMSHQPGLTGRIFDVIWATILAPAFGIDTRFGLYPEGSLPVVLAASLTVLAIGLALGLAVVSILMRWLAIGIDTRLLLGRLTRIIVGVAILVGLSWAYGMLETPLAT